jgi:hypothetical protein
MKKSRIPTPKPQSAEIESYRNALPYIKAWQDAYWSYMLEHAEITKGGSLFVKFHSDSRATFEKHVRARYKYQYHREDPVKKEEVLTKTKEEHIALKKEKQAKWKEDKRGRFLAREVAQKEVRRVARYNRLRARIKNLLLWLKLKDE